MPDVVGNLVSQVSELGELRLRLLDILRGRLSGAKDDEMRQTNWEATSWDLLTGEVCLRCGKEVFRIIKGLCLRCLNDEQERSSQLAHRISLVMKRYPKLTRGLRKKISGRKGAS